MGGFGVVVVVDTARRPVGLLTPRHIAVSGAVEGVRNRMSTEPIVATWNTKLSTAMARMRRAGVRHLPVVDLHGALVGLLTVEDGRRPRRA